MENIIIEDFATLSLDEAKKLVSAQTGPEEESNWKFYNDDHWQDGEGYTGPKLSVTGLADKTVMDEIERQFTYFDVVRELVDHHCDAVTAKPPQWGSVFLVPPVPVEGEEAEELDANSPDPQDELDESLRRWSDDAMRCIYTDRNGISRTCDVPELLSRASRMYAATGRANLRPFIPPRRRAEDGTLPPLPFEESLRRLYFELLEPGVGAVYPDRDRMESIAVLTYEQGDIEFAETSFLINNGEDKGRTVLRQVSSESESDSPGGEAKKSVPPVTLDLGGRLWLYEMCDDPLLMGSILSQQKSINKALTMAERNMDIAGFVERVMKNVQPAGKMVDDPDAAGGKKFVPSPMQFGPGSVNNLLGVKVADENGKETYLNPDYQRTEPVGSQMFDDAAQRSRSRMLDQSAQTYVEMEGDGSASGVSRQTARQRFRNSIGPTADAVTGAGDWLFNIAVCIARQTSSEPTAFEELRVDFHCQLDLGALSASDRTEDREQVKAGQMSRETAMTRGGIEDVDAESGRINAEASTSLAVLLERAQIMQTLMAAGAGIAPAARLAGFNEEQVAEMGVGASVAAEGENGDTEGDPTSINPADLQAGIQAENTLNGAQITAALSVFDRLNNEGEGVKISSLVAVELLASVGIPRETAQTMVNNSSKG